MVITETHIDFIRRDLFHRGIHHPEIAESLLDHICCYIENSSAGNFDAAYLHAVNEFGPGGLKIIQDTSIFYISKKERNMKKTMVILGYVAACLTSTGLLFTIQHWPGARVMLVLGIALLNFGFLPLYFYDMYRKKTQIVS